MTFPLWGSQYFFFAVIHLLSCHSSVMCSRRSSMLSRVSGVPESCALRLKCVCKNQSGCRGTQVETKQMSAGAGSVCDRGASVRYAGRAAWCSSAVQRYRLNKLSGTRVGLLWHRATVRRYFWQQSWSFKVALLFFFTRFDSINLK